MKFPFLASLVLTPAAGALVIALVPRSRPEIARVLSLLFSVVVAALSIATLVHFRSHSAAFQMVSQHRWIPDWGVSWKLGIDGISLFLVVLTGVLFPIAIAGPAPRYGTCTMLAPVLTLSISPRRWPLAPLPCDAKLRPPGFDLASATKSVTDFAGLSSGTASSCGKLHIRVIGLKSLIGS